MSIIRKDGEFKTFDAQSLFYRTWEHKGTELNGKILIVLHRGHEHSERLNHIVEDQAFAGYKIYSYDNRGHGYSKTEPSYEFMDLVRDLEYFVKFVCEKEGKQQQDIFVIANSVAGVTASTWIHDFAPKIAGVALVAPAFKIKLYFPLAETFLRFAIKLKPKLNIKSYVKSKFLTHNIIEQDKYNNDKLITPHIPARQLTTLLETGRRVVADAGLISTPALVFSAGKDMVVDSSIQGDFYANLSSKNKKFIKLENFYHGVLYEDGYEAVIKDIALFMDNCFLDKSKETKNINTQYNIFEHIKITQKEKDLIAFGSLPIYKKIIYSAQRLSTKHLGFLSEGISIGNRYGFDSGVTLDYVYKNQAKGKFGIGKLIDRGYLNSVGWQGIRQRKENIINSIQNQIDILEKKGEKVELLDIAGGPARYLIEIAKSNPNINVSVRDYQQQNIEQGRKIAKDENVNNINYQQVDAFNPKSYENIENPANIIIISGVFELFSDNDLIEIAIKGVSNMLPDNGCLIYTGQPFHPQLELIANTLGNHLQGKWIMRRRSQYELDLLFSKYGFNKTSELIDNWGVFTVSTAMK